jgi:thymidine kinase
VRIGEAAKAAGKAWTLLIDEVQYLNQKDLAALIVSLHKVSQENLPVLFLAPDCRKLPPCPATPNPMLSACSTIRT